MNDLQPSKTAYKVALNILTLGEKPEMAGILPNGIVDATEKLLIASDAVSARTIRWSRSEWMIRIYEAFDWMMPGQFEAFAHRKAFFERQVQEAIAAGTTQVLVLGAGYDTMGWRLAPQFPHVNFYELDHPATASLKAAGVKKMGPRPNLHLIAVDLGERELVDVLIEDENWDRAAPTIILAEGLLQYLPPQAVQDLFTQCAAISTESRIAFTYIPTGQDGRPDAGQWTNLVLWLLRKSREPWLWSIRPEGLGHFLKISGWLKTPELVGESARHGVELYAVATKTSRYPKTER
jgi:methyltransferase (TIGR00027 family)